jgi:hypothetical protein
LAKFSETAADAIAAIESGEHIWSHSMAATPTVLLDALAMLWG